MHAFPSAIRPVLPVLIGASIMLSLAMGLRQSLGIFMPPLTQGIGISVSDFTIAIAVQNLSGKTVIEAFVDSEMAQIYMDLAKKIMEG